DGRTAVYRSERIEKNAFLQSLDNEEEEMEEKHSQQQRTCGVQTGTDEVGEGTSRTTTCTAAEKDRERAEVLEIGVQYWTDYAKWEFHHKSVLEVGGVWQTEPSSLAGFGDGRDLVRSAEMLEAINDRIRFFVEECDHLQGFQAIVDDSGGFAAVAADVLSEIADDYGRSPCLLFSVRPPVAAGGSISASQRSISEINNSLSYGVLSGLATCYVPMGRKEFMPQGSELGSGQGYFPHIVVNEAKPYHTSALYAAAIEACTLPWRLRREGSALAAEGPLGCTDLHSIVNMLHLRARMNIAAAAIAFPTSAISGPNAQASLMKAEKERMDEKCVHMTSQLKWLTEGMSDDRISSSLSSSASTALATVSGRPFSEMNVLRGARVSDPATGGYVTASVGDANAALCDSLSKEQRPMIMRHIVVAQQPLALPLPFPRLFRPYVTEHGDIEGAAAHQGRSFEPWRLKGGADVTSAPILARLSATAAILPALETAQDKLGPSSSRTGVADVLEKWGFSRVEVEEIRERLSDLVVGYGGGEGDEGDFMDFEDD
ncbi:hypothetical protein CBR_g38209, partial [Chara braunii]